MNLVAAMVKKSLLNLLNLHGSAHFDPSSLIPHSRSLTRDFQPTHLQQLGGVSMRKAFFFSFGRFCSVCILLSVHLAAPRTDKMSSTESHHLDEEPEVFSSPALFYGRGTGFK